MAKKYFTPLFLICLCIYGTALSQAKESTAEFKDTEHPVFTVNYNFPSEIVLGAIQQRLKQDGLSSKSRRNVISSEGVHYKILTPDAVDLYFQVESRGKKGRDGSTVDLFISKGKDNFVGSNNDPELAGNAIQYLNDLQPDISIYALQQQIKQQQSAVDKKAKDYKGLLKDSRKLESKRYDLQRDLSGEINPDKQDKLRKKIEKLDKSINKKQMDIRECQRDLDRLKDQLSLVQDQLKRESKR